MMSMQPMGGGRRPQTREELEAQLMAQGMSPEDARALADSAMLGTEAQFAMQQVERGDQPRGIQTPGRYGMFVGDPMGAATAQFQAQQARQQMGGIIDRGKEAAGAFQRMAQRAMSPQEAAAQAVAPQAPDATQARVAALRGQSVPPGISGGPSGPTAQARPMPGGPGPSMRPANLTPEQMAMLLRQRPGMGRY